SIRCRSSRPSMERPGSRSSPAPAADALPVPPYSTARAEKTADTGGSRDKVAAAPIHRSCDGATSHARRARPVLWEKGMRRFAVACLFGLGASVGLCRADEGLWTFDDFPAGKVEQTYGFAPDAAWLDHARLATVGLPGCSAGIVSRHGLIQTNHHCV